MGVEGDVFIERDYLKLQQKSRACTVDWVLSGERVSHSEFRAVIFGTTQRVFPARGISTSFVLQELRRCLNPMESKSDGLLWFSFHLGRRFSRGLLESTAEDFPQRAAVLGFPPIGARLKLQSAKKTGGKKHDDVFGRFCLIFWREIRRFQRWKAWIRYRQGGR
ncbi:hypothetical protein U1Q18_013413 [Sarracenia purpurea var. burkii]